MRRLALVVVALAVALAAVEAGVRALAPQAIGADVPLLRGPLNVPGDHRVRTAEYDVTVHVNARGFVDREWGPKTQPRVVVIGDSFVQAAQVPMDAGFGRVLDALLPDAEVLSMGVPGAGTATELGVLETYALPMQPDVVVLGFLVANDVMNNHPLLEGKSDKPFYALRDGALVRTDAVAEVAPRGFLWEHSHLFRWVERVVATREIAARRLAMGDGVPVEHRVYALDPDPVWEEAWAVTDALIGEMARVCAAHGVRFGVVLFPEAMQVDPALAPAGVTAPDLQYTQIRATEMAARHAPAEDLTTAFQFDRSIRGDGGLTHPLYFATDGHWTAEGHRVAAQATAPFVERLLAGETAGAR